MNYSVEIAQTVRDTIRSWNIPRTVLVEVFNRLSHDLPADPDGLLGGMVVPYAAFSYEFTLKAEGPIPYQLHFFFLVARDNKARKLSVIKCRLTEDDRGEN